jgi:KDO2-lipid IV(A) lauroyltransferase
MFKQARYLIEYAFVVLAGVVIRALTPEQTLAFGQFLGRNAWRVGLARRLTMKNLAAALPEMDRRQHAQIGRACLEHAAITFLELMRMPLIDPRELNDQVEFEGLELMEENLRQGRGAVCLSAHFGNWEIMGAALVARGLPVAFMVGQQSNKKVDELFNSYRRHCNIHLIALRDVKQVLQTLKRGQFVALLGDQDGDKHGMFQPFFGRAASTFVGAAVFCRKTGTDLFFGVPVRLGARKHKVMVQRLPSPPEGLSDLQQDAFRLRAYNHALEAAVRAHPGQWWWMHNRWEARPEHRLGGAARARAEQGQIRFDMDQQAWVDPFGAVLGPEALKP